MVFSPAITNSQDTGLEYNSLVPLPGAGASTNLQEYLPTAFNLVVGIAVAMAFVMITFGGVTYATSDALSGKTQGREYITNALVGLLLVIGSYVILQTINPEILNFDLEIERNVLQEPEETVYAPNPCCTYTNGILNGYVLTPAQQQEDIRLRGILNDAGVRINASACTYGGTRGCTNIVGLSSTAINGVIALNSACNSYATTRRIEKCAIMITGGTEGGHATHGPNRAALDLSPTSSLNTYLSSINPEARSPRSGTRVNLPGGGVATYENAGDNGRATGAHWHIQY